MSRQASISRKTNETQIDVSIDLDCQPGSKTTQNINVSTGIGFLDHVILPWLCTHARTHPEYTDVYGSSQTLGNVPKYEVHW